MAEPLRGYDRWLDREPDEDDPAPECVECGDEATRRECGDWYCSRCYHDLPMVALDAADEPEFDELDEVTR